MHICRNIHNVNKSARTVIRKLSSRKLKKSMIKQKNLSQSCKANTIHTDIANCFKDNYAETFQSEFANERDFIAFLGNLNVA